MNTKISAFLIAFSLLSAPIIATNEIKSTPEKTISSEQLARYISDTSYATALYIIGITAIYERLIQEQLIARFLINLAKIAPPTLCTYIPMMYRACPILFGCMAIGYANKKMDSLKSVIAEEKEQESVAEAL